LQQAAISAIIISCLPISQAFDHKEKREVIVTTDHGLSLTNKGLSHGNGGVFEEVVFKIRIK